METLGEFIIRLFIDGGLFFTCPIFILLIIMIGIWIKAFRSENEIERAIFLITQISWFTLAWGYLGRTIGIIETLDSIAETGDIATAHIADGLKIALLSPFFGLVSFLIARLGLIILKLREKNGLVKD